MIIQLIKSPRKLAIIAVLLALIFTGTLWSFNPTALWDWLIQLGATFISVIFAIALFWYQREKGDEERQEQLLTALSAETSVCLRVLDETPSTIRALDETELGTAVLVPLPATVLDEAIRSGLHHSSDTFGLIHRAAKINAHNSDVEAVRSVQSNTMKARLLRKIIERLNVQQDDLVESSQRMISLLEAQGIPQATPWGVPPQDEAQPRSWWRRWFGF